MKQIQFSILVVFSTLLMAQEMNQRDLKAIEGKWTGNLVYLDYSSNKEVMIPVELTITRQKEFKYQFIYVYPKEPKANSKEKININLEERKLEGNSIESIERGSDGWVIKFVSNGKDNGKPAQFINTYTIGNSSLSIKKEVQYESGGEIFMRNEYRLEK